MMRRTGGTGDGTADTRANATADDTADDSGDGATGKLERIIAGQVRRYRLAQGISASELALRTGISKAMVSKIETASTSCSLTTLQRLADGLEIPVTALFRGADTDRDAACWGRSRGAATPSNRRW
jgi:ribosome-binding protein aMBF1 (putative translation factor)